MTSGRRSLSAAELLAAALQSPVNVALRPETDDDYASYADLLALDDLPECDITIPKYWKKSGKPLVLRVRALSLLEQDQITRYARLAAIRRNRDSDVKDVETSDEPTFLVETLTRCVMQPRMTAEQAREMRHKNPVAVRGIVDFVWGLSVLDQSVIDRMVDELTQPELRPDAGDAHE